MTQFQQPSEKQVLPSSELDSLTPPANETKALVEEIARLTNIRMTLEGSRYESERTPTVEVTIDGRNYNADLAYYKKGTFELHIADAVKRTDGVSIYLGPSCQDLGSGRFTDSTIPLDISTDAVLAALAQEYSN